MSYDKSYYEERKLDLQKEFQALVNETYTEIERLVVKKFEKARVMSEKLQEIEKKEAESKSAEPAKTPETKKEKK